jgi:hypothetical protein
MAHDRGLAASPGVDYTISMGSDDHFSIPLQTVNRRFEPDIWRANGMVAFPRPGGTP